jgi:hypothetical protein
MLLFTGNLMKPIKIIIAHIIFALTAAISVSAFAQSANRVIPNDSRLGSGPGIGSVFDLAPAISKADCAPGKVKVGSDCVVMSGGGGGATLLPYDLPGGSYYNNADYPLQVNLVGAPVNGGAYIIVNGRLVSRNEVNDQGTQSANAIVPAKTSFAIGWSAVITALANNATWKQTGIKFSLGSAFYTSPMTSTSATAVLCYADGGEYGAYIGYFDQCVYGTSTRLIYPGPIRGAVYMYSSQVYGSQVFVSYSCPWTQVSSNNWGESGTDNSGSITPWPIAIAECNRENVAHYFNATGPFVVDTGGGGPYQP